ncbi:MAG: hypothetical protein AB1394_10390 [Bacteroidota bacterium]
MSIIDFLLVILLLSASSLCIFLIIYLKRILVQLVELGREIHQFADFTNKIVNEVEGYWSVLSQGIKKIWRILPPFRFL